MSRDVEKKQDEELNLRMFDSTGNYAIDKILDAVAFSSKWSNNSRCWSEEKQFGEYGLWSLIQERANEAAKELGSHNA